MKPGLRRQKTLPIMCAWQWRGLPRVSHLLCALIWMVCAPSPGPAIPPPYVSDEELARHPIIVVGRWKPAPFRDHSRTENLPNGEKILKNWEVHTELVIDRVIKGDLKLGTHEILLGF